MPVSSKSSLNSLNSKKDDISSGHDSSDVTCLNSNNSESDIDSENERSTSESENEESEFHAGAERTTIAIESRP